MVLLEILFGDLKNDKKNVWNQRINFNIDSISTKNQKMPIMLKID